MQSNFYTIESAENVPQSPVLSAFLPIGLNVGSAIIGAVSVLMLILFGMFCRKSKRN